MARFRLGSISGTMAVVCVATAIAASAQTFTTLFTFDGTDGSNPSALIQGTDGNFYGVTSYGGTGYGTAFKIAPDGSLTTLYTFCSQTNCTDGRNPIGTLLQTANGSLYGTTLSGGANNWGSIFEITPAGKFITLYSFCSLANCSDGVSPYAGLVLGTDGNFYGTTSGSLTNLVGTGTVFKITPAGGLTTLHNFCVSGGPNCPDGLNPFAPLVQASNGNFYGTTATGGSQGPGVVYEITSAGKFAVLYNFCSRAHCVDGASPSYGLVQATNGDLYGATYYGGANCISLEGCGTIYEITLAGKLTTLYSFCSETNCPDGRNPYGGLAQATDGNLYSTTYEGGASGDSACLIGAASCGTIFKITPKGLLTTLYSFCPQTGCQDGGNPLASLLQATNGTLYGSTNAEGDLSCEGSGGYGCGTIFSLSVGLGSFVEANPNFGKVGQVVDILGNNLTGATAVSFDGTTAKFKVISSSYLEAQVPTGAATGMIEVTTPSGVLKSNGTFHVLP